VLPTFIRHGVLIQEDERQDTGFQSSRICSGLFVAMTLMLGVLLPAAVSRDGASVYAAPRRVSITTNSPLPSGTAGTAYSQTLVANGGTPPYTWSVTAGALPAGLSLSSAGVLSGTPTTTGTANFTVRAADSGTQTATKAFALTINNPLSITTSSPLPSGTVGTAYSQTLAASGGAPQ